MAIKMITEFSGDYFYLSNYYKCPISFKGLNYGSAEAAFQAQKVIDEEEKVLFTDLKPNDAKLLGNKIEIREDWDKVKDEVMYQVVKAKFIQNKNLGVRLLFTDDAELIEGNYWKDDYWGRYTSKGLNKLGKILMRVREEIKHEVYHQ